MKETTPLLMFTGLQAALAILGLMLVTTIVVYHLFAGHFGLLGATMATAVFYLAYRLTVRSIREFRAALENKDTTAENN